MTSDDYPLGADCDVDAIVAWLDREVHALDWAVEWAQTFLFDVVSPPFIPRPGTREHFLPSWDLP